MAYILKVQENAQKSNYSKLEPIKSKQCFHMGSEKEAPSYVKVLGDSVTDGVVKMTSERTENQS